MLNSSPLAPASVCRPRSRLLTSRATALLRIVPGWITRARRVTAERQALSRMDDRMLADIGIDPATAKIEAARRFWDFD
jgi:uncharacterized protein YjiS (DUF1127 family)